MNKIGETISFGRMSDVLRTPPFSDTIEPDNFRYNSRVLKPENPIFRKAVAVAVLEAVGEDSQKEALSALEREGVLTPEEASKY